MQLIAPIQAAALVPPKIAGGSAQKAGNLALMPIAAMENITIPSGTLSPVRRLPARPTAVARYAAEACQRRSPVRSEFQPTNSMAGKETRKGMAAITDTSNEL